MKDRTIVIAGLAWGTSLAAAVWLGQSLAARDGAANVTPAGPTISTLGGKTSPASPGAVSAMNLNDPASTTTFAANARPVLSIQSIMDMEDPVEKMAAFLDLVRSCHTNEDFENATLALTENFDPRGRGRELSLLMTAWAKLDPKAALAMADSKLTGRWGSMPTGTVLQTWSKTDPNAAKAWALEKGSKFSEEDGNSYMTSVISGLAGKDLALAATWAQEQPRSKARGDMMDKLLDAFTKQRGTQATEEWAASLPEGPFRDGSIRRLAARMSEKDPVATAQWINRLPVGEAKYGAMSELIGQWSAKDPNAAGLWLKNIAPSAETDDPRTTFAWNIREQDPESAIAWAGTISDQKRRDKILVELVRDWNKRDPQGAQDYMERNQWPEEALKKAGKKG
jgi:hypothetical protein